MVNSFNGCADVTRPMQVHLGVLPIQIPRRKILRLEVNRSGPWCDTSWS
jgi:hypothetical protein